MALTLTTGKSRPGDKIYLAVLSFSALVLFVLIVGIATTLAWQSRLSLQATGFKFVTLSVWDDAAGIYGIWPFLFGTLYSSLIALLLAVPISLGAAIFLAELCPKWLRTPITFLIELLAAIPSVVYGLWGIFVLTPFLRDKLMTPLAGKNIPLFSGAGYGPSMLTAGVILAIMILPFITAVSRDILQAIPKAQREASYGLGGTKWETISKVVLPYSRSGIIGAVMLGLGRAFGETMAVTMVIGNQPAQTDSGISLNLFEPGYTMSSALANKFNEAQPGLSTSALIEIGLVLFLVAVLINTLARILVRYTGKSVNK
ncbi:phosphate ABC transporter permease subunit PstC [Armatimonas sp.]|uniref:phosphate ABC transporter permease subunit PstC n=1 Tax=Armatimonas sp. TaxID=1872638 RepID=UPI00286CE1C3|nr:phosphate ABC transporter permease subunit PstC [Armatimonas sp.]